MKWYGMLMDRLAKSLYNRLANYNDVKVDTSSQLHKDILLRGAKLRGMITLQEGVKIIGGVHLKGVVTIGKYTSLNGPNTDVFSLLNPVTIGSFCSIARNVSIQEYDHDIRKLTSYYFHKNILNGKEEADVTSKGGITIGHDVWIGAHSVILSGARIGNGVVVAANSVVTGDIPDYAIVGGAPAKVLKYRFEKEVIDELLLRKWWDLPMDQLVQYFHTFNSTVKL